MASTAQRLTQRILDNKELKDKARLDNNRIKQQEDFILAQITHIAELENKIKAWEKKQKNGYTAVVIVDDMISQAVTVPAGSRFTYTQPIPKELGSAYYDANKFYELNQNGKMIKNIQKYNRYVNI